MRAFVLALTWTASFAGVGAQPVAPAPLDLPFTSFFRHPVGPRGLEVSDALRAADGRSVRLVGYMVLQEDARPGRFLLAPRPVQMSEHADGDADDLPPGTVTVLLDDAQRDRVVVHRPERVALTGQFEYGRHEDDAGKVSWIRLRLAPEATATATAPRDSGAAAVRAPSRAH